MHHSRSFEYKEQGFSVLYEPGETHEPPEIVYSSVHVCGQFLVRRTRSFSKSSKGSKKMGAGGIQKHRSRLKNHLIVVIFLWNATKIDYSQSSNSGFLTLV